MFIITVAIPVDLLWHFKLCNKVTANRIKDGRSKAHEFKA